MTAGQAAALYGVWVIAVISPGPDLVVVLHRSLAGRRHGVATAAGVVTGIAIWLAAAFAGLAALVRVYPQVMTGMQVAGGLLLASLGALGLRGWW
uniref:LysE family transporter n=1 Tax=Dietzia sp. SYD-A1 TaxID=2780141 RepID=UPI0018915ECA